MPNIHSNPDACKPMRERIATVLWKRIFPGANMEPWLADADAVLAAMREPTNRMCSAGPFCNEINPNVPPVTESQADACWQAMIDAAKAGG